ncbi:MAG: hypothetical protein AMDU5_GPLC00012G0016 [Thermoplasmatales archaeon Gpl]|nr:MAG: hypothetical protein AMDU5_GPLC00012G0016 [Thermoplasmatales archaeon Gpl]
MKSETEVKKLSRIRYFVFGLVFIILPFISINYTSYLDYGSIINGVILVVLGIILMFVFLTSIKESKIIKNLPYIGFVLSIVQLFFVISTLYPNALTDEIILQTYAAKIFLEGKDPYIKSNMLGAFSYIKPYSLYVTPGLNGKLVEILLYPGMSVLAFLPVVYFHLPDYTTLFIFSALNFLAVFLYLRKTHMEKILPYFSLIIMLSVYTFGLSIGGSTDILWIFFLVLAYIFREKPWLSGLFYGLSISSKQLAIVAFPFLIFMIFMEKGKSFKQSFVFFSLAAFSFLLTNLPFIIMQPYDWLRNIVEAEFQPVLGIGIGFSELSFTGLFKIPSTVFTLIFLATIIITFLFYVRFYSKLKYALFIFPMLMFLVNYRVLLGYIVDWSLLIVISFADYLREENIKPPTLSDIRAKPLNTGIYITGIRKYLQKNITFAVIVIIIISLTTAGSIYLSYNDNDSNIYHINAVENMSDQQCIPGYITSMNISITYQPALGSNLTSPIYFRIIPSTATECNYNGMLWYASSSLHVGQNYVTAYPESYAYLLKQGTTFRIQAYYNYLSDYITVKAPKINRIGIANYNLQYPTNNLKSPFLCWGVDTSQISNRFNYHLNNGNGSSGNGFTISLSPDHNISKINCIRLSNSAVNLSYLKNSGDNLNFNYSYSGNGTSVTNDKIKNFVGVEMTINGIYDIYIGMNRTVSGNTYYSGINQYIFIQRYGNINFTRIYAISNMFHIVPVTTVFNYELYTNGTSAQNFSVSNIRF